jgi:plastocyanin
MGLVATAASLVCAQARAAEHEIRTRANQWVPVVLFVEPGDTIVWRGMEGHETELIEMMGPENVAIWDSDLDDEGFSVTLDVEGAYIYKCEIHLNAGMVGAIVVGRGEPQNLAALETSLAEVDVGRDFVQRVFARMSREIKRRFRQ